MIRVPTGYPGGLDGVGEMLAWTLGGARKQKRRSFARNLTLVFGSVEAGDGLGAGPKLADGRANKMYLESGCMLATIRHNPPVMQLPTHLQASHERGAGV